MRYIFGVGGIRVDVCRYIFGVGDIIVDVGGIYFELEALWLVFEVYIWSWRHYTWCWMDIFGVGGIPLGVGGIYLELEALQLKIT